METIARENPTYSWCVAGVHSSWSCEADIASLLVALANPLHLPFRHIAHICNFLMIGTLVCHVSCHVADAFIQNDLQLTRLSRRHTPWSNLGLRAFEQAVQILSWPHQGSNHRPCGSKSSCLTSMLQAAPPVSWACWQKQCWALNDLKFQMSAFIAQSYLYLANQAPCLFNPYSLWPRKWSYAIATRLLSSQKLMCWLLSSCKM